MQEHTRYTHLFKTHLFDKNMFSIKVEVFFKSSDKEIVGRYFENTKLAIV